MAFRAVLILLEELSLEELYEVQVVLSYMLDEFDEFDSESGDISNGDSLPYPKVSLEELDKELDEINQVIKSLRGKKAGDLPINDLI